MAVCEKCWADAYMAVMDGKYESQTDAYESFVASRKCNPAPPVTKPEDVSRFVMEMFASTVDEEAA